MRVIAESSSTRTEWVLVDGQQVVEHAFTEGLNPYFQSRREISHSIRLELPEAFFRKRWEHVYFYGAGCANIEKNKVMESSLVAQFKTPVTVQSDLLGAARGLLVRKPGLACILGTGSNSCLYDGEQIVSNVRPAGFILGDEGSSANMGKLFVADCLKQVAPAELISAFYEQFNITPDDIMDAVYTSPLPNRALASYSTFLAENVGNEYVYQLVYSALLQFFKRNVAFYDYKSMPVSFVGSTACAYADILKRVASDFGAEISKIIPCSMPGLVEFHATEGV